MTKPRIRNVLVPAALAVLAAVLVGVYIASYRNNVNEGAGLVNVLVASRDIPAGTAGSSVASGGYLKTESVPKRTLVDGSVASAVPLTSKVTADPIYKGEQITLRQFKPLAQAGIFAKFSGRQRAIAVLGTPSQMLAGTLKDGDRVDVIATVRYHTGPARATTRVVLKNLLVLAGSRRRQGKGHAHGRGHPGNVRDDRPPGTDDGLGHEDEHLVPRAAADEDPAQQRAEPGDAPLGSRARAAGRHRGRQDQRRLPGGCRCALTDTIRRGFGSS